MILTITVLSALVVQASLTPTTNLAQAVNAYEALNPLSDIELSEQLYDSVVVGDYKTAVMKTLTIENNGRGNVIRIAVNKLLSDNKRNVVEFAYNLWNMFSTDIVKDYFPKEFRMIFNEDPVLIINNRDELALKLQLKTDSDGDRISFGDSRDRTSHRVSWKIYPLWEKNRVFFKILNTHRNQYLKLEIRADGAGDHKAFGSDEDDTYRHQWYFHPVSFDNETLFYIYNRQYNQALKLGRYVDSDGDRTLWGHNGDVIGNPEHFGWHIAPF